jgi:tetratricopeptide (TPR) repeat protein
VVNERRLICVRRCAAIAAIIAGLLLTSRQAAAANGGDSPGRTGAGLAVGAEVILAEPGIPLRDGDRSVPSGGERLFRIEKLGDPFVAVVTIDGGIRGWVKSDQILTLERAIDQLTRELRTHPEDVETVRTRGQVWLERRDWNQAVDDLDAAIRLAPLDARNRHLRGQAWAGKSQLDQAIADFSEAIRLDPQLARAFRDRGLAWDRKRYFDRAIADLNEAVRLEPGNFDLVLTRGKLCSAHGRHHQAMADFEWLIRMRPSDPSGYVARGEELIEDLEADAAIADLTHALEVDPQHIPALLLRGKAWKRKYDHAHAIADFAEAARRMPDDPRGHEALAWILATCPVREYRDGKRAVEAGTTACELTEWRSPDSLNALAAACAEAGDFASAVKWQGRAVELLPVRDKTRMLFNRRLFIYQAGHPYRD